MLVDLECKVCKKVDEYLLKRSETIPSCCGQEMSKLMSPSSFILKGEGWFKDGYQKRS